jgi:hypothetical protein
MLTPQCSAQSFLSANRANSEPNPNQWRNGILVRAAFPRSSIQPCGRNDGGNDEGPPHVRRAFDYEPVKSLG